MDPDEVPVYEFQKFDSSIHRILKQVRPDAGITLYSYPIINKIINHIIKSLSVDENITIKQLDNIIDELFPVNIARHAKNAGNKANYHNLQIGILEVKRATELIWITPDSWGVLLYISGVCEYIIAKIVELAGNCARDDKKKKIKPKHILIAIIIDDELDKLFYKMIRKLVSQRDWLK